MRDFSYDAHSVWDLKPVKVDNGVLFPVLIDVLIELGFDTIEFQFQVLVHSALVELIEFHLADKSLKFKFAFLQGGSERQRVWFHVGNKSRFKVRLRKISVYLDHTEKKFKSFYTW
jgi:hypothetical protein